MNPFGAEELISMCDVLLSGMLTMGEKVAQAEQEFAKIVGAPYAVMVNSGSSANLLAVAAISNKFRQVHCNFDDEVLVPAVRSCIQFLIILFFKNEYLH
jgi:CDP-6-deoxy-D-xylo-4-hexulose-3-dehydrase